MFRMVMAARNLKWSPMFPGSYTLYKKYTHTNTHTHTHRVVVATTLLSDSGYHSMG